MNGLIGSPEAFYEQFGAYHNAIWPIIPIAYILGIIAIILAKKKVDYSDRTISGILGFLWIWTGIFFLFVFFSSIIPMCYFWGLLFIVQGVLFWIFGVCKPSISFKLDEINLYSLVGLSLVIFALIIYPLIGMLTGHNYPTAPIFPDPCPICVFTFGLLLLTDQKVSLKLLIIPLLWSLTGIIMVTVFKVYADLVEVISGVIGTLMILFRDKKVIQKFVMQGSNPKGRLGRIIARGFNRHHARIATWGLTHLSVSADDIILDIGCGGGRDVKAFARMAINGKIYGIDISEVSVEVAKKANRKLIEAGRVEIQQASVSSLPFEENTFDLVTGVEAYNFWPDLINDLKEIYRILKPGGTLALINEGYKSDNEEHRRKSENWARTGNFNLHTPEEFKSFFKQAVYSEIELIEEKKKGWLLVKGRKPIK